MFRRSTSSETFICRQCGKIDVIDSGPHSMALRVMYGVPSAWIAISTKEDQGIFCTKKCARKWLKKIT